MKPVEHRIRTINNSNGISVLTVVGMANTTSVGVVTCTLVTPIGGFTPNPPFAVGDQIFVEGIQLMIQLQELVIIQLIMDIISLFQIIKIQVLRCLSLILVEYATAVGVAKTNQQNYATITNFNKYPQFKTTQKSAQFTVGEKLGVRESGNFVLVI